MDDDATGPPTSVGPRTGSDPSNSAQEVAVLRAEVRGLEARLALLTQTHDRALSLREEVLDRRFEDRWKSHEREHQLILDAVGKAERAVDVRLEGMNELRSQIERERGNYITRAMYDDSTREKLARIQANSDSLIKVTAEVAVLREDLSGMRSGQEWLVRLVSGAVITTVIGLLIALFRGAAA